MATLMELDRVAPTIGTDVWPAPTTVLVGEVRIAYRDLRRRYLATVASVTN